MYRRSQVQVCKGRISLGFRDKQKPQKKREMGTVGRGALRLKVGCEAELILGKIWKDGN